MNLHELKQPEVARLCGVDVRTIQRWHEKGFPRQGEGKAVAYDWEHVLPWLIELRASEMPLNGEEMESARLRKLKAEADMAELERDQKSGKLCWAAEVVAEWGKFLSNLRSNLMGYPDRVVSDLDDGQTLAERRQILRTEMVRTLRGVAEELRRNAGLEPQE